MTSYIFSLLADPGTMSEVSFGPKDQHRTYDELQGNSDENSEPTYVYSQMNGSDSESVKYKASVDCGESESVKYETPVDWNPDHDSSNAKHYNVVPPPRSVPLGGTDTVL